MITSKDTVEEALRKAKAKKVYLEGNFVKILSKTLPTDVKEYVEECKVRDKTARRKRLDVTKQVQAQNKELEEAATVNKALVVELQNEKDEAEKLRDKAVEDLDVLQKRTQFELVGQIVRVALVIIVSVGVVSTTMYLVGLMMNRDTTLLGNAWTNLIGILLTNSFSIIGTIMGVKYATGEGK
tara:strand:+ start:886 stop:1434 length:549 start_codon:yes stop_codon:yes gene_type:complete